MASPMLNNLWAWLQEQLQTNMVFSGAVGVGLVSTTIYWLRQRLMLVWEWCRSRCFMELTIYDYDPAYYQVWLWLSEQSHLDKARSFRVTHKNRIAAESSFPSASGGQVQTSHEAPWQLSPGPGVSALWLGWRPVFVSVREQQKEMGQPQRSIAFRCFTRSREPFNEILKAAHARCIQDEGVPVYFYRMGGWYRARTRPGRAWSSIVVDPVVKDKLRAGVSKFFSRRKFCADRGIPWRSGALLFGPPGTGKTSIALGLATEFNCALYVCNLSDFSSDTQLSEAMGSIEPYSILVMEDVDVAGQSKTRRPPLESRSGNSQAISPTKQQTDGVTQIGLLNAIDGIPAPEGRYLLMTTNHKEVLDPALIRSGRVDIHAPIDKLDARLACQLYGVIWPETQEDPEHWLQMLGEDWSATGADLQNCFIHYEDPTGLLAELRQLDVKSTSRCRHEASLPVNT
jgi:chaperone BCS1